MSVFSIIGIALIGVIMSLLLKNHLSTYALMVTLLTGIIILCWCIVNIIPVIDKLQYLIEQTNMPNEYGIIIFKSIGLTFIVQLISDICKDAGETAISSKLELMGKIAILLISLPLFEKIISVVLEMLKY